MSETIKLDALPNACIFKKPCAVCGVWDRPNAPWWVFLDGDISRPVCGVCAKNHDSTLFDLVSDANAAHYLEAKILECIEETTDEPL
ncbi:MAG: hypothetical protein ACOWWM_15430 [Desulfobacterales bacterium]